MSLAYGFLPERGVAAVSQANLVAFYPGYQTQRHIMMRVIARTIARELDPVAVDVIDRADARSALIDDDLVRANLVGETAIRAAVSGLLALAGLELLLLVALRLRTSLLAGVTCGILPVVIILHGIFLTIQHGPKMAPFAIRTGKQCPLRAAVPLPATLRRMSVRARAGSGSAGVQP